MLKKETRKLNFAVFGDVHGRVALMYTLAYLWQSQKNTTLDGILQVGDMGAYPNPLKMDQASKKYAQKDPDELGFSNFCKETDESKLFLSYQQAPETYFIRGNHEDFEYLSNFKNPGTVDPWGKITYIPNGQSIHLNNSSLVVGAFGGIPPSIETKSRGKKNKKKYKHASLKSHLDPRYFTYEEIEQAFSKTNTIDILMTHAGPLSAELPEGSSLIQKLAEKLQPKVHLFGHHHKVIGPVSRPGESLMVGLEHLEFNAEGSLIRGSWGILSLDNDEYSFYFPSEKEYPFLQRLKQYNYRELANEVISQP
ncbi:metallophosphoesterase family protein [Zooshikella ganghwensis]|uniref:metallophosphoesterase family protein n=1 Tax=Zooshikella ganghwensis TaxID=202772 RepID=UPI0004217937|nr:metallophosphoesterase [Zooshikella ganghwensis]